MKKLLSLPTFLLYASLFLFFFLLSLGAVCQSPKFDSLNDVYTHITTKNSDKSFLKTRADSLDYQIFLTRYCLNVFRTEQYVAMGIELAGGVMIALAEEFVTPEYEIEIHYDAAMRKAGNNMKLQETAMLAHHNALESRDKDIRNYRLIGGGIMVAGGILHIASYRWLRKAYIQPSKEGIGIVINF